MRMTKEQFMSEQQLRDQLEALRQTLDDPEGDRDMTIYTDDKNTYFLDK